MTERTRALTGTKIGLFGKGGSGKSTAVVLLAEALADRGYKVCILDADSTNLGLAQAFGFDESPISLMELFGGTVFRGGLVTCPVDDPTPLSGAEIVLKNLPAQYYVQNQFGITLLAAGKIGDQGPGAGCDGPVSKIARDVRLFVDGENALTLVDFKAGFEDSARGVITGLDWALVIVDPTRAAVEMAANMRDMFRQMKAGFLPATSHLSDPDLIEVANRTFREARIKGIHFILNKVEDEATEIYLRERLREKAIAPIGVIHRDPTISLAWLRGMPLDATTTATDVQRIVEELEHAEQSFREGGS
jgi:CO dehydrogenase nickel-insertion accessory protein CooC1